jgi:hypothetical protein
LLRDKQIGILNFMQSTLRFTPLGSSEQESKPIFNVTIAYEDFETGKQAKQTYDFLVQNLGRECEFANQMWKFDVLSIPKLREMAAKDAIAADIVIICCHGRELPEQVRLWFDSWVQEEHHPLALVALIENGAQPSEQSRAVHAYLADAARRAKVEFFAQPEGESTARRKLEDQLLFHRDMPNFKTFSALAGAVERDAGYARWSINE